MKLNKRKEFKLLVSEKFLTGQWGLNEFIVLKENKFKYNLNLDDLGLFLFQIYQYTYHMALEDGIITKLEKSQLNEINMVYNQILPRNVYEKNALMNKISTLVKSYEKTNGVQENLQLNNDKYEAKKNIEKGYRQHYFTRMKLTPYGNYNF